MTHTTRTHANTRTHCSTVTHDRHMPPFLPLQVLRKFRSPPDFRGQLQMCISGAALTAPPSSRLPVSLPCQAENKMKTFTVYPQLLPPPLQYACACSQACAGHTPWKRCTLGEASEAAGCPTGVTSHRRTALTCGDNGRK